MVLIFRLSLILTPLGLAVSDIAPDRCVYANIGTLRSEPHHVEDLLPAAYFFCTSALIKEPRHDGQHGRNPKPPDARGADRTYGKDLNQHQDLPLLPRQWAVQPVALTSSLGSISAAGLREMRGGSTQSFTCTPDGKKTLCEANVLHWLRPTWIQRSLLNLAMPKVKESFSHVWSCLYFHYVFSFHLFRALLAGIVSE